METVSRFTCVTFVVRTSEPVYIDFFKGDGCFAQGLGMNPVEYCMFEWTY